MVLESAPPAIPGATVPLVLMPPPLLPLAPTIPHPTAVELLLAPDDIVKAAAAIVIQMLFDKNVN